MKSSQHKLLNTRKGSAELCSTGHFFPSGKKGASTELIFLVSLFGIVLILSVFYVWVQKNVTDLTKEQADTIGADLERRIFFSELIHAHGNELANKNENEAEDIIENFAKNYATIEKGDYDAVCSTEGQERSCTLEITIHDIASTVWIASFFTSAGTITIPAYVLMKALSLDILDQTKTTTYLPTKQNKAIRFTLDTTVEFA